MDSYWVENRTSVMEPSIRQVRFETSRVTMLMKALGLKDRIPELVWDCKSRWGYSRLTFEMFNRRYTNFPFMLSGQSFYATTGDYPRAGLAALMTRFHDSVIHKRYMALQDRYKHYCDDVWAGYLDPTPPELRGLPLGMVFPWDAIHGGLILHNSEPLTYGSRFLFDQMDTDGAQTLCIELYKNWLRAISRLGWTPGSPRSPRRWPIAPLVARGVVVSPGLNRLVGLLAAPVMAWLLRASGPDANLHERNFVSTDAEGAYLTITAHRLGTEVGADEQAVGRAVDLLCRMGYLRKHKLKGMGNRNGLRVDRARLEADVARLERR